MDEINFYNFLEVPMQATLPEILFSYRTKIKQFYNKDLSENDIIIIKLLKAGLHILSNETLRKKYDIKLLNKLNQKEEITSNNDNNDNNDFNNVFNTDNSWMKNSELKIELGKKNKEENNFISDRIFSIMDFKNSYSTDFETKLRHPIQDRGNKISKSEKNQL